MANITLDAPLTLNPTTATQIVIERTAIDHLVKNIMVHIALRDANGVIVERRILAIEGAQVATWIGNQEATIVAKLLAKMGVSGTAV